MLKLEGVDLSAGGRDLLAGVDLHLRPGDRLGLVGRNGTGKSTLLKLLAGVHPGEDAGQLHRRKGLEIGYLPQDAVSGSSRPLWEEARTGMRELVALEAQLERAEQGLDESEASIEAYAKAQERFELAGGWTQQERIGEVLHGLGFRPEDWRRPCDSFSGGWQVRIALARLLLSGPDLLLLDEPTNHLDLHSRGWLASFLEGWRGALVLVGHDRHVLERCTNCVAEIQGQHLSWYGTGFRDYLVQREQRLAQARAQWERHQRELGRAQEQVARLGAKATRSRQVHSRLARVERSGQGLEAPVVEAPPPRLRLEDPPGGAPQLFRLKQIDLGYGEQTILSDVNWTLQRGERVFLLGPNGAGKSTLLKLLGGELSPQSGKLERGRRVKVGWYEQDQALALPGDQSGLDYLMDQHPFATQTRARAALGSLGLKGERALQSISTLSGGEKARVALASLALGTWDLLLLDEPSNHLDAITVEVLIQALQIYSGSAVIVSHDRHLVERLATHTLVIDEGGAVVKEGIDPEDLQPRRGQSQPAPASSTAPREEGMSYEERKRLQRERERLERRVQQEEDGIAELEAALEAVDASMMEQAEDLDRVLELSRRRQELEEELASAMERWEQASTELMESELPAV